MDIDKAFNSLDHSFLTSVLKSFMTLLPLTPQAAIFGFLEADCQSYLIQNHILLILKLYIYKFRKNKFLSSTCLLKEISKIKNIEKKIASVNEKKTLHIKETGEKLEVNYLKRDDNTVIQIHIGF